MNERVLDSAPPLPGLFARAGMAGLPLVSSLPLLGGAKRSPELPDTVLRLDGAGIERERLARYSRVCGFSLRDRPPASYPHVLAFPLQLALMTDPSFPFPAIGLVHIENEVTQHRPIEPDERLSLRVWAEDLRPHPRGRQFSLRTEARVGEELVWEETSVNLRRGRPPADASSSQAGERAPSAEDEGPALRETAVWRLPADLGRRYAAVAGDLNPIHLHPLSARLFGFPRAIAHGMWTKARCLAALEPGVPSSFSVSVRFRQPILLPAQVTFFSGAGDAAHPESLAFAVRSASGKPHLEGRLAQLVAPR